MKEENGLDLELTIKIFKIEELSEPVHGSITKENVIDFSVNLNPLGPPFELLEKIKDNIHLLKKYPSVSQENLKENLSMLHLLSKDCFYIGSGATQLIYDIALFLKRNDNRYYIISPTFGEYERASLRIGCETFSVLPEKGINPVFGNIEGVVKEGDVIFLCNPNNPTGSVFKSNELLELVSDLQKKNCFICVDESFAWFLENIKSAELINYVENYDHLIIIRSLTKLLSLPGLRIGYLASNKKLISKFKTYQNPWSVSSLAEIAIEYLLNNTDFIIRSSEYIKKERNRMFNLLSKINVEFHKSEVNFYMIKSRSFGLNSRDLTNKLLSKNIGVRDCSSFRGLKDEWIRVAVRKEEENNILYEVLKEILNG